jgi:hypothetical protein
MNTGGFHDLLVVFSVRPALEEPMVDWLLAWGGDNGFTSLRVEEHDSGDRPLTTAEQVRGRQTRVQFQVRVSAATLAGLLSEARKEFAGADVHYWVLPLLEGGPLQPPR